MEWHSLQGGHRQSKAAPFAETRSRYGRGYAYHQDRQGICQISVQKELGRCRPGRVGARLQGLFERVPGSALPYSGGRQDDAR